MFGKWLMCTLFFGTRGLDPCSALDTFLPDPGMELQANQILKLIHEEGERFDLFPMEAMAFVALEFHPSKGTPMMLVNMLHLIYILQSLKMPTPKNLYVC